MGWMSRNLPKGILAPVRNAFQKASGNPPVGEVDWGDLRRTRPFCSDFGTKRGLPVDRHYIESFLASAQDAIRGRTLEVGDDAYTRKFGGARVSASDVLHVHAANPKATIVADLQDAPGIPDASFDCIIFTQTLQFIARPEAAVATLFRILRPGGTLLVTVPGLTQIGNRSEWGSTWYWSFTERGLRRLLESEFGEGSVSSLVHGNVLAAVALLHGMAASELEDRELAETDSDYQVIIAARAVRSPEPAGLGSGS
jgi:SAM-dependent methyltransferase